MAREKKTCSVEGCGRPHQACGFCSMHYRRWLRHGDPIGGGVFRKRPAHARCSVAGCDRQAIARRLCHLHWQRDRKHGTPTGSGRTSPGAAARFLEDVALPYEGDHCLIWPFSRDRQGYARTGSSLVSRIICRAVYGEPPTPRHEAAHSCGKGHLGCVTKRHLRWATKRENETDKRAHGTLLTGLDHPLHGENHPSHKLTTDDVRAIRLAGSAVSARFLARKYNVARPTIDAILLRRTWAWLD